MLVDLGLRRVGARRDVSPSVLERLDRIDGWYLGDGWYEDGAGGACDWYAAWAFHTYGLLYAASGLGDPVRAAVFRERASEFAGQLVHWFAADGAALPFGRSLTYRFAQAAFWGALALADVEALRWGQLKGLYLRSLRHWTSLPVWERDGVLSVGYGYDNRRVAERYIAAASPYWAFKAFLPLAAPADHPFWTAEEEPSSLPAGRAVSYRNGVQP